MVRQYVLATPAKPPLIKMSTIFQYKPRGLRDQVLLKQLGFPQCIKDKNVMKYYFNPGTPQKFSGIQNLFVVHLL